VTRRSLLPIGAAFLTLSLISSGCKKDSLEAVLPPPTVQPVVPVGRILYLEWDGLHRLTADGSQDVLIYSMLSNPLINSSRWSPDLSKIVATTFVDALLKWQIITLDPQGKNPTTISSGAFNDGGVCWSSDGSKLAFSTTRTGALVDDIYIMNADGTSAVSVTSNTENDYRPDWSPDGIKILYQKQVGLDVEIFSVVIATGIETNLTNDAASRDYDARWSPDGTKVALTRLISPAEPNIYVMNADGSGMTQLTTAAGGNLVPCWSPDGSRILFRSGRTGPGQVFIMNPDGTGQTQVTSDPNNALGSPEDWR